MMNDMFTYKDKIFKTGDLVVFKYNGIDINSQIYICSDEEVKEITPHNYMYFKTIVFFNNNVHHKLPSNVRFGFYETFGYEFSVASGLYYADNRWSDGVTDVDFAEKDMLKKTINQLLLKEKLSIQLGKVKQNGSQ